jgi:hypothetical protein
MTEPVTRTSTTGGYRVPLARPRTERRIAGPPRPPSSTWQLLGIATVLLGLTLFGVGQFVLGKRMAGGLIAAPILLVVSMAILNKPAKRETTFDLRGLLLTSIGIRLICAFFRFLNPADAVVYNNEGARIADDFRNLNFTHVDIGAPVPGTGVIRYLAGIGHLFTDSNWFGTTMIWTFMALFASWFAYRAVVIALPSADRRRYARFVMLWPSLLYWPSSLGKDAWMAICIALAALGAAKMLTRGRGGYLLCGIGLAGAAAVRPHVALLVFGAVAFAYLIAKRDQFRRPGQVGLGTVTKFFGIVLLLIAGAVLAPATAHFLKVDSLSTSGVSAAFASTQAQTSQGGSAFHPVNPNSPIGYPMAVFTVFFRPLPGELHGLTGLVASVEGFVLLLLCIIGWRRFLHAFHILRSEAYVTFCLVYLAAFGYAFSAIANFGILTRERVQALPYLFVPLSLPKWQRAPRDRPGRRADGRSLTARLAAPTRPVR